MSLIHNNVAISDVEYTKISKEATGPWKSSLYTAYNPLSVALPVVLADNAHDNISHLNLKSGYLENNMLEKTRILLGQPGYQSNPLLIDIISSVGKCFAYQDPTGPPINQQAFPGYDIGVNTPFDIPDNKLYCLIRDCFPGTWVPGLNNIFDQAGASLKTFIEYHNSRNGWTGWNGTTMLRNPVKKTVNNNNAGGLGQQLKNIGRDYLKYTAYFNYDLLWFKYITVTLLPTTPELVALKDKVIAAIDQGIGFVHDTDLLTPDEIIKINTVNINFLWCNLMVYCFDCVVDDEYFRNKVDEKTGYLDALQKLTQIRFDSFAYTQDGYISNPFIYYRSTNAHQPSNIFTDPDSVVYINEMCTSVYNNLSRRHPGANIFGVNENLILAGGVEYVTSQAMAASCMRQFIALFKSSGRSKNTGDFTKISSMHEINTLFNTMVGQQAKVNKGYGWAILKFSGDSSHIVFGDIMEDIKLAAGATTDLGRIEIIYAISERPLLARLLAAKKNVYFLLNNASVLKKYYTGPGSEFKNEPHAVLYIQWDPSITFNNIVDGFVDKINDPDPDAPRPPGGPGPIENAGTSIDKLIQLYGLFGIVPPAATAAAAAPLTKADYNNLINEFKTYFLQDRAGKVAAFLKQYRKKQVEKKMLAIMTSNPNYSPISSKLGAQGRAAGNTNWFWLMDTINAPDSAIIAGGTKGIHDFDEICLIFNLLVEYYIELGGANANFYNGFFGIPGFFDIFKKIIISHRTTLLKRKDTEKIETFIQTREQDWISSQKKNSERIPNKVGAAITQMETLMLNCWKLYDGKFSMPRGVPLVPGVTKFGGNDNDNDYVKKQVGGAVTLDGLNIRMDIEERLIDVLTHSQIEDLSALNDVDIITDIAGLKTLDKALYLTIAGTRIRNNPRKFQINERLKIISAVDNIMKFAISHPGDATATAATAARKGINNNRFNKLLNMNPSKILAKRLKLLDISADDAIQGDIDEEVTCLVKALIFLRTYIQSLAPAAAAAAAAAVFRLGFPGQIRAAAAAAVSQILTNLTTLAFDVRTVLSELSSLKDIKEDSGIVLNKGSGNGSHGTYGAHDAYTEYINGYYNNDFIDDYSRKKKVRKRENVFKSHLETYFPHLNEDEYEPFLELVQELAKPRPILFASGADDNARIIYLLQQRVLVSKILSKSRLMEIIFNDLAEPENIAALRHYPRTRIERFFTAVNSDSGYLITGGKKTIKKRNKPNHRKTKRNKPNPKNKTKNNRKKQIKAKKQQKRRTIKKNHKK